MSFQIVHITDLHFDENTKIEKEKVSNLVELIRENGRKIVIVLIGGDISNSGNKNQYDLAFNFFHDIYQNLNDLGFSVVFICAPGNHDLKYKKGYSRTRKDVLILEQKNLKTEFDKETRKFDNYYEFEERITCLNKNNIVSKVESATSNRYINHFIVEANGLKCDVFSLNNAMFSFFDPDDKYMDNEKGVLHLIHEEIEKIKRTSPFSIMLMHFPIEYFSDHSRRVFLQLTRKNIDLILTGHIHEQYSSSMISSNGAYKAVQSGQFSKSNNTKSEFTSIILKEEKSKLKQFTWSTEYKCYKKKVDRDLDLVPYTLNLDDLEFSEDFIQEFYKDTQGNFNVIDYFVFPIVTCRNIYEDNETNLIGTFEEVNEIISRNKLIIFEGPESSGKTTVLKYLHKKLISDNIVLFTNGYELKSIRNPKKLLKNLFLNQYQDVIEEKFYKYNINQRILIIDDAENKTEFINKLQNYFGKIIITLTKTKSDKIIDIIMKDILNKDETSLLEINYFYRKKRVELAKRMYTTIMKNNGREVNNRAINKFTVKFNNVIETRLSFFGLSPLNIFFLVYHLAIKNNEEFRNIYNDVFTSNLTMQIKRSADKNELKNYKPYVTATQKIAFEMNKNTTNFMTSNQINDVIIKYNKDYNQAVKLREYLNVMSESKILVEPELDHWYFNNKNFLAYYASQEYVYLSNYYEKNKHIFNDLLKNIHIGVNDKILLFLAFSQQNERIIIEILRQSDMLFEGIDEMELNKFNFLNKPQI